jgi:hypothetical protein
VFPDSGKPPTAANNNKAAKGQLWSWGIVVRDHSGGAMATKKKTAARRKAAPKRQTAAKKKVAGRRELIDTGTNKLFVRRNERGTSFKKVVDAGKSITRDKRTKAWRKVPSGQGDRGDRE